MQFDTTLKGEKRFYVGEMEVVTVDYFSPDYNTYGVSTTTSGWGIDGVTPERLLQLDDPRVADFVKAWTEMQRIKKIARYLGNRAARREEANFLASHSDLAGEVEEVNREDPQSRFDTLLVSCYTRLINPSSREDQMTKDRSTRQSDRYQTFRVRYADGTVRNFFTKSSDIRDEASWYGPTNGKVTEVRAVAA
jgi:hypothetical protein